MSIRDNIAGGFAPESLNFAKSSYMFHSSFLTYSRSSITFGFISSFTITSAIKSGSRY